MTGPVRLLACITLPLAFTLSPAAQATETSAPGSASPLASGYVTRVDPSGAFDVGGIHIRVTPATVFWQQEAHGTTSISPPPAPWLGEPMDVYGRLDKKADTLTASRVVLIPQGPAHVGGTAIIDLVPAPPVDPGVHLVRADGYLLRLTPRTSVSFAAPLASMSDLGTNVWIDYHGVQQADGTILLDRAALRKNLVNHSEDKLRTKREYDPAAIDPDAKQSGLSKAFLGIDPKLIPPYTDDAMQARIDRIGESLVPAFQRILPDSDPTRIHFRFQLIDSTRWRDALSLPSGIILVPRQVVERLESDSQLATVLADNIAEIMEKETFRAIPAGNKLTAANLVADAGGIFVPGLGVATSLATAKVRSHINDMALLQSGRVSLFLLHDAGYDIAQAPLAWWLLSPKKPEPLEKIALPARAANLYMALGTTWHTGTSSGVDSSPAGPSPDASAGSAAPTSVK